MGFGSDDCAIVFAKNIKLRIKWPFLNHVIILTNFIVLSNSLIVQFINASSVQAMFV